MHTWKGRLKIHQRVEKEVLAVICLCSAVELDKFTWKQQLALVVEMERLQLVEPMFKYLTLQLLMLRTFLSPQVKEKMH